MHPTENHEPEVLDSDESAPIEPDPTPNLMIMGIIVEGGLLVLAILIGWFGFCDNNQSLFDLDPVKVLQPAFIYGVTSLVPLLILLLLILRTDLAPLKRMRQTVDELLGPLFKDCSVLQIAILSLMAGLGEELFFRWCLQGGLAEVMGQPNGPLWAALIIGVLFGLCHFITLNYAVITALIGIYLGWVMNESGTYLAPALSHALFDFVALLVVVKRAKEAEFLEIPE